MSYYLEDHPNLNLAQFGWLRARIWESGQHLSGVIGVHTSEAITDFEGPDWNAENNAKFLETRTNHGSYTTSADADSILPLVHPRWAAWADIMNNAHAMSVAGCLQAARWLEMTPERRRAVVVNMAVAAARMVLTAVADGYLAAPTPAVRISAAEAISGSRPGFYGHGETNPGTRYDPGAHFDWGLFLATYANAIGGGINFQSTTTPKEWDEMASEEQIENAVIRAVRTVKDEGYGITDSVWYRPVLGWNGAVSAEARLAGTDQAVNDIRAQLGAQHGMIAGLIGALAAVNKGESFDEAKLLAGVQAAAESGVRNAIESKTFTLKEV